MNGSSSNTEDSPSPRLVVLKFGGSSVASAARWSRIHHIISRERAAGRLPVVVCSAVKGITDALVSLADTLDAATATPGAVDLAPALANIALVHRRLGADLGVDADEVLSEELGDLASLCGRVANGALPFGPGIRASILAFGERLSTRLGAAWLGTRGVHTAWVDARDLLDARPEPPEVSDDVRFLSARCDATPNAKTRDALVGLGADAVLTQGFVARDQDGATVVLGRGGSDTSAAYLAAIVDAVELQIWTDVPGLFTADPRVASGSRLLRWASYHEAATLGGLGAKVLHPRCLEPVRATRVPVRIGWTEHPDVDGTVIGGREPHDEDGAVGIKAVTCRKDLYLVRMRRTHEWQPVGYMARVAGVFRDHGLSMDLLSSSPGEIRATLDAAAFPGLDARLDALCADLSDFCEVAVTTGVACVSLVGSRISDEMDRIASVLELLGAPAIHLVSHAADDSNLSYVVDGPVAGDLVAAMHESLFGMRASSADIGPTWRELVVMTKRATAETGASPRALGA